MVGADDRKCCLFLLVVGIWVLQYNRISTHLNTPSSHSLHIQMSRGRCHGPESTNRLRNLFLPFLGFSLSLSKVISAVMQLCYLESECWENSWGVRRSWRFLIGDTLAVCVSFPSGLNTWWAVSQVLLPPSRCLSTGFPGKLNPWEHAIACRTEAVTEASTPKESTWTFRVEYSPEFGISSRWFQFSSEFGFLWPHVPWVKSRTIDQAQSKVNQQDYGSVSSCQVVDERGGGAYQHLPSKQLGCARFLYSTKKRNHTLPQCRYQIGVPHFTGLWANKETSIRRS